MTDLMLPLAEFEAHPDRYILIDVRDEVEFAERHIPGAINMPLGRLRPILPDIPAGSVPVTVCGKGGCRSTDAAASLRAMGLATAVWLEGGTIGWFATGYWHREPQCHQESKRPRKPGPFPSLVRLNHTLIGNEPHCG